MDERGPSFDADDTTPFRVMLPDNRCVESPNKSYTTVYIIIVYKGQSGLIMMINDGFILINPVEVV